MLFAFYHSGSSPPMSPIFSQFTSTSEVFAMYNCSLKYSPWGCQLLSHNLTFRSALAIRYHTAHLKFNAKPRRQLDMVTTRDDCAFKASRLSCQLFRISLFYHPISTYGIESVYAVRSMQGLKILDKRLTCWIAHFARTSHTWLAGLWVNCSTSLTCHWVARLTVFSITESYNFGKLLGFNRACHDLVKMSADFSDIRGTEDHTAWKGSVVCIQHLYSTFVCWFVQEEKDALIGESNQARCWLWYV